MTEYYNTNLEHIQDELTRIDSLIQLRVLEMRAENAEINEFSGLYIAEEEIDALLSTKYLVRDDDPRTRAVRKRIAELKGLIDAKKVESLRMGIDLRLPRLANIFGLSSFEEDVLVIGLAPEVDRKYERLYGYLQNDATKKQPSVDVVLQLLCSTDEEKLYARHFFDSSAPLVKHRLIEFDDGGQPLVARFIKVDDRIINYLLGFDQLDPSIAPFTKLVRPQTDLAELVVPETVRRQIQTLISAARGVVRQPLICLLQGPYGAGKKMVAQGICTVWAIPLLTVDLASLGTREVNVATVIACVLREALLRDSAVYLEHFERLNSGDATIVSYRESILEALEDFGGVIFIASESPVELDVKIQKNVVRLEIPVPDYRLRKQIWERYLNGRMGDDEVSALATKFKFTGGQIRDALRSAENQALLHERATLSLDDLYEGCRRQSNQNLVTFATRIKPKYTWTDIVLPKDKLEQLREVKNYIKYKGVVYHEWGFETKLSLGKGLNVLFSGPSGTGKTMAAEVLASELHLDLYKIDLSMVVSKYIGETEKNLSRIFKEAEQSNAILFFDEADALFGKRSEVRDSHDRYANIEISYLLQKMEEHEGIVILATNLSQNIDEAFKRRMHFTIEFPFPEEEYRYKIWRSLFPKDAPLGDDIDFEFLAKKLAIAGGTIKNIIVTAAFLAAEDSRVITMEHIMKATKREFQKMGKVCSPSDFGKYYALISEE